MGKKDIDKLIKGTESMILKMIQDDNLKVQVMMFGGRRCGKTSVLAAMKENFEDKFAQTDITVSYEDWDTLDALEVKSNEIKSYFREGKDRVFTPDSNPTEEMITYKYSVGISQKKGKIKVDFVDYPGEWITDTSKRSILSEYIENTQVVIIAIDTPHLMEENGKFNESRNFSSRISNVLKMTLDKLNSDKDNKKMFLFVPLKCERYLAEGKMEEVRKMVDKVYSDLINYLKRSISAYEVAITPIFTMGTAMFSRFERDATTGEILINNKFSTPEKAIYYFTDLNVKEPEPKYCEQPLVYLLAYLMKIAVDVKNNNPIFIKLLEKIFSRTSEDDYKRQIQTIKDKLKKDGDGYCILQNPLGF